MSRSAFREALARDAERVFLNLQEFGEEHVFNGVALAAVVEDSDAGDPMRAMDDMVNPGTYGLDVQTRTVRILDGVLPRRPVPLEGVVLDGLKYEVVSVVPQMGMLDIVLARRYS